MMARLNVVPISPDEHNESQLLERGNGLPSEPPLTPEDTTSGSEKENFGRPGKQYAKSKAVGSAKPTKRKSVLPVMADATRSSAINRGNPSKRRRLEDRRSVAGGPSQVAAHRKELAERVDTTFYDPDQDEETKRSTTRRLRDLASRVHDSRAEYLQPQSKGIQETLAEADEIYKDVKQTSVATIDSRLLVNVGDLAYRKINTLTLGDSSTGVDVDDFVTKCISFMRRGGEQVDQLNGPGSTQSRQRRQDGHNQDDDDDEEEAVDLNWGHLGRSACFLYNSRPCLTGFLLGPLSVQKKTRQQSQRKTIQARADLSQAIKPLELAKEDLERQESANLTVVCAEIARLLHQTQTQGEERVSDEVEQLDREPAEEEIRRIMHKHGITDNGCVPLFDFCVNPRSFGQTVENFFYVSFLIKEGKVGLDFDSNGLPTLGTADAKTVAERQETRRNQAVFTLDFEVWEDLIKSFSIRSSIIPHRREQSWDDGTLVAQPSQANRLRNSLVNRDEDQSGEEEEDMYG